MSEEGTAVRGVITGFCLHCHHFPCVCRNEGNERLIHVSHEFYLAGVRFSAGTYKIIKTEIKPSDDVQF